MEKLLRGVVRYNGTQKSIYAADIKRLGDSAKPQTIMISCMDARVFPTRFTQAETGQMFILRNAGNMVPHFRHYLEGNMVGTEGAGLELGVMLNGINNVVVCGHSDCKAVNALYDLQNDCNYLKHKNESPLKTWITLHGRSSIKTFSEALAGNPMQPLVCQLSIGNKQVTAHIDSKHEFTIQDRLSQLHCLKQVSNLSSYPFLKKKMEDGSLQVHAMWFDIIKGDVYFFSPKLKSFAIVDESNINHFLEEIES